MLAALKAIDRSDVAVLVLDAMGITLNMMVLYSLIMALGMLVDNAIVVVDGVLIRMQKGDTAEQAAAKVVKKTAWPLLGATVIAILAFAAIGTSNDATGEYCRSLFQVVMVSLLLSWVTAVTVTPLLCVMFLKPPATQPSDTDPYGGGFYRRYKGFLRGCIRHRYLSSATVTGVFAVALWGFTSVVVGVAYPAFIQKFRVEPNESVRERPFIQRNIDATRDAFKLAALQLKEFPADRALNKDNVGEHASTIDNIRLWHPNVLIDTYRRLQAIRQYYEFHDVDIDRYVVESENFESIHNHSAYALIERDKRLEA